MYLINNKVNVNWTFYTNIAPPLLNDISVTVENPSGNTITDIPIELKNFIPSGKNKLGGITHELIPDIMGLWKVSLYILGKLIHTYKIYVGRNDSSVKKFISSNLLQET